MNERQVADEQTLHPLLDKLIAGSLTKTEFAELQSRLQNNPYQQQAYFNYLDLDTDLREMSQDSVNPSVSRNDESVAWSPKMLLAALAASLLFVVSAMAWFSKKNDAGIVSDGDALLVQSAGARFFRDVVPGVGESLKSNHPYALTAGMIELKFANGAEVILEAPTAIEIVNSDRMIIKQGSCSVHAPPGAEGFEVLTPEAKVTDLGTRFAVSVTENGETEVQVVEGAAEIRHRNQKDAKKVLLKEHQASRLDGGHLMSIEFVPDQYRKRLPDRLIGFQVGNSSGKADGMLQRVSVQRSGEIYDYEVGQLIGIEVIHFRGGSNTHCLSVAVSNLEASDADRRSVLESDVLLHTGMLNLGGSKQPLTQDPIFGGDDLTQATPGIAVRFREPVVNGPGPDMVFFEIQCALNPLEGDAFHVSPTRFGTGMRSVTVTRYDITLDSPEAQLVPDFSLLQFQSQVDSLDGLLHGKFEPRAQTMPFYAIAVGIDLSDMGYAADVKVEELFFQDASDSIGDADDIVDPVFIGGLPPIKEETK